MACIIGDHNLDLVSGFIVYYLDKTVNKVCSEKNTPADELESTIKVLKAGTILDKKWLKGVRNGIPVVMDDETWGKAVKIATKNVLDSVCA